MPQKMIIEVGEPQPFDCPACKASYGYQFSDFMKIHYTTIHEADGSHYGGAYSDSIRIINEGSTPYCSNCGAKLPFKLKR